LAAVAAAFAAAVAPQHPILQIRRYPNHCCYRRMKQWLLSATPPVVAAKAAEPGAQTRMVFHEQCSILFDSSRHIRRHIRRRTGGCRKEALCDSSRDIHRIGRLERRV
jgi:hypothetical protein